MVNGVKSEALRAIESETPPFSLGKGSLGDSRLVRFRVAAGASKGAYTRGVSSCLVGCGSAGHGRGAHYSIATAIRQSSVVGALSTLNCGAIESTEKTQEGLTLYVFDASVVQIGCSDGHRAHMGHHR